MKKTYTCPSCQKEFLRYQSQYKPNSCCSKECCYAYQSITQLGANNPNFGNKWNDEQRKYRSKLIKSIVNDEYREKCGRANRGKKFSKERIERMHGHRTFESYSHTLSDESKKLIGIGSKAKFTPEYFERVRKINEELGYYIPLKDKDDYMFYKEISNWIDKMFDIVDNGLTVLKKLGIFNIYTNTKGCVRDHIFSRKSGFENNIFPELLRHPSNCQIISHAQNVSKRFKDEITLDEFLIKIQNYNKPWKEHELCLGLIKQFKSGNRYNKEKYINEYYKSREELSAE